MAKYGQTTTIGVILCICTSLILTNIPLSHAADKVVIRHDPLTCAVSGMPIGISAEVVSATPPKEVRVYFKMQNAEYFYYVPMKQQDQRKYIGVLPAPMSSVTTVEYLLLVVDADDHIVKTPVFSVKISAKTECPGYKNSSLENELMVHAEQEMSPEIGFSGEHLKWNVNTNFDEAYLNQATLPLVKSEQSQGHIVSLQSNTIENPKKPLLSKKMVLGIGVVGVGAYALYKTVIEQKPEGGINWSLPVDDRADNIAVTLNKFPLIQTSCGTIVTNQLFVTNNRAEALTIGLIDYEIVLTKDKPSGSCEPGRVGVFAPNLLAPIQPGETTLVREWSNEVNPCRDCPYLLAECVWNSRYIVRTSAGSAVVESNFTVQGDLCNTPTTKPLSGFYNQIKGDLEP